MTVGVETAVVTPVVEAVETVVGAWVVAVGADVVVV